MRMDKRLHRRSRRNNDTVIAAKEENQAHQLPLFCPPTTAFLSTNYRFFVLNYRFFVLARFRKPAKLLAFLAPRKCQSIKGFISLLTAAPPRLTRAGGLANMRVRERTEGGAIILQQPPRQQKNCPDRKLTGWDNHFQLRGIFSERRNQGGHSLMADNFRSFYTKKRAGTRTGKEGNRSNRSTIEAQRTATVL